MCGQVYFNMKEVALSFVDWYQSERKYDLSFAIFANIYIDVIWLLYFVGDYLIGIRLTQILCFCFKHLQEFR